MCTVGLAVGLVSFAGSSMSAIGQHQAQQAAVARSNAIAQQQYKQQLQISAAQDQEKARTYEAQLKAQEASKNAYWRQVAANQAEADRGLAASAQKAKERKRTGAFQAQDAIVKSIQAQGSLLANGRMGQSFLLQAMEADRTLGFEQAQIDATLYDAARQAGVEQQGILLDQHAANTTAWNGLPANPLSPQASFIPLKPMKQAGPSGLALAGSLISGAASAYGTGHAIDNP